MQGKGNVVRRMFREIDAQCYLMVDGDDTYSANDAPALANRLINDGADMVIGDRLSSTYFEENKKVLNSFGNILMRKAINSIFRSDIKDIMTGYRAFSFDFVKTFPVTAAGFDIETEMTGGGCRKGGGANYEFAWLPLSKNFRPVACFGLIALILFVIAAVFLFPILVEYFQTGLVPRFPTLIVCGFLILTAIISLFAGVLLSNIVQKNRRDFEIARLMVHGRYSDLMKENVEEVLCQDSKAAEMDQEFRRR